jgi:hypothetical protein
LAATAGLRAQTSEAIANLLAARQQVARAEHAASTSKAAVDSSSKASELLNEQVRELENAMLVLEDELAEENLDRDMASNASARKNEFDADYCIAGASADNERGLQHPYAARLGLHQMLALGVSPSAVVSTLSIGGADVFQQGRPPPRRSVGTGNAARDARRRVKCCGGDCCSASRKFYQLIKAR